MRLPLRRSEWPQHERRSFDSMDSPVEASFPAHPENYLGTMWRWLARLSMGASLLLVALLVIGLPLVPFLCTAILGLWTWD